MQQFFRAIANENVSYIHNELVASNACFYFKVLIFDLLEHIIDRLCLPLEQHAILCGAVV